MKKYLNKQFAIEMLWAFVVLNEGSRVVGKFEKRL